MKNRKTLAINLTIVVIIAALIGFVFYYSLSNGYYTNPDFIEGIVSGVHGMFFESILIVALIGWLLRKREKVKTEPLVKAIQTELFDSVHRTLTRLIIGYVFNEKQYVYFGNNQCINRVTDISYQFNTQFKYEDESRLTLTLGKDKLKELIDKHENQVENLLSTLSSLRGLALIYLSADLNEQLILLDRRSKHFLEKLNEIKNNESIDNSINLLFEERSTLLFSLFKLKNMLVEASDKTCTREEKENLTNKVRLCER